MNCLHQSKQRGGFYSNEYQFSFDKYSTKLKEAYSTLTLYQNYVQSQFHVKRILGGIQVENALNIDVAKVHLLESILVFWLGFVFYMSVKVAIQLPPSSGVWSNLKGDCRVSKFYSKRGRWGGRGRCRGRVRGVYGGNHSGSDRHDPSNRWFHVVDCSDFRRSFSGT